MSTGVYRVTHADLSHVNEDVLQRYGEVVIRHLCDEAASPFCDGRALYVRQRPDGSKDELVQSTQSYARLARQGFVLAQLLDTAGLVPVESE